MSAAGAAAIVGGLLGAAGGIVSGIEKKKAATKFRRRQRGAIRQARTFADDRVAQLLGDPSRFLVPQETRDARTRMGSLLSSLPLGGRFGEGPRAIADVFSREGAAPAPPRTLFERGVQFLAGTFDRPEDSPLADQLRKSLRVAQESRGLRRSVAGAVGEARALGAFTQNLRASLLPQLVQFGTLPEQLRQSVLGFEAPLRVASATGAPIPGISGRPSDLFPNFVGSTLGEAAAGAAGGFQIGRQFDQQAELEAQRQQFIDEIRAARRGGNASPQFGGFNQSDFQLQAGGMFGF